MLNPFVPSNFAVRPLRDSAAKATAESLATCNTCGLSWDDSIVTEWTPAPSARCPFEYFHGNADHPAIGSRVEIPVHYDLWMRGARFGTVTAFRHGAPGTSDYVLVKLDHAQARKRLKVWRTDWDYMREVAA